jgi:chorismate mutase
MISEDAAQALARLRHEIDTLDLELLVLLNRRTRVVEEIGRIKESLELPVYEPRRESDVINNVTSHNAGPLTPDALQRIFERIIDEMRSLQRMRRQQEQREKEC